MSKLPMHRTPWMQDSKTCAPCAAKLLQLMSNSMSDVVSLQAKPKSKFLGIKQIFF